MAEVNYQTCDAQNLADVFLQVKKHTYAGMIFEKLGIFDAAGDAFERAQDIDRAIYCYERGRFDDKVKILKRRLSEQKNKKAMSEAARKKPSSSPEPLSLEEHVAKNLERKALHDAYPGSQGPAVRDANPADIGPGQHFAPTTGSDDTLTPAHAGASPSHSAEAGVFSLGVAEDTTSDDVPAHLPSGSDDAEDNHAGSPSAPPDRLDLSPQHTQLQAFEHCRFLEDFSLAQKQNLWQLGETEAFDPGMTVLHYQESPKGLYVITSGHVSCHRMLESQEVYLESIGPSESFGELWLLTELQTTVCFRAKDKVTVRVISRERFSTFIESDGVIARKVYKRFTNRLLRSLLKPRDPLKNQAAS
jgi:hypothetical protein